MKIAFVNLILISLFSLNTFAVLNGVPVADANILNSIVKITGENGTCTGIVVGKRTILTAAHCIDAKGNINTASLKPLFVQKFETSSVPGKVTGVLFSFSTATADAGKDVGYIYLQSDLYLPVAPIKFSLSFSENDELCVAGQGKDENGNTGTLKMYCGLRSKLNTQFGLFFIGSPSDPMAGFGTGDSGGPVYKKLANGSFEIVGVVSRGYDGKSESGPPIFSMKGETTNLMTDITSGFAANWVSTYKCQTYNLIKTDPELCGF